jgi:Zn-dependent protease with chaperone function
VYELVVLPAMEPFAFSLPGHPAQVIVSSTLVSELDDSEFEAVVRHERAHLELHHGRFLLFGAIIRSTIGWIPIVRTSVNMLTASLERWADEASTGSVEDREALHRALRNVAGMLAHPAVAAFSRAETIVERLDALQSRRSGSRRIVIALSGGYAVLLWIAGAAVADWIGHAHALVASVPYCPV